MTDSVHFNMGEYRAEFPTDRRYTHNHMWASPDGESPDGESPDGESPDDGCWRFGFTAYAVRLLQDVYFLDWIVDAGTRLDKRQEIGQIESKKAEASLYAPITGEITCFNEGILNDPSAINVDAYGSGWLFGMVPLARSARDPETADLLTPDAYLDHLAAVWEVTQRTIRGQINE